MTPEQIRELAARSQFGPKTKASGRDGLVVSSSPIVSRVGADMLRAGGNAVDAVLAAAVAQTVVEPHMSTSFGVLSMMYYEAASGRTTYLNGSMNAPLAGLPGFGAHDLTGGRAVAVPGFWAAYEAARKRYATRSSAELIAPAISLAEQGFPIYPFLHALMFHQFDKLGITEEGREIYFRNNALRAPGELLVQKRLAETLKRLATDGADHFYRSDFTRKVVEAVRKIGGVLTMEDFDRYEARWVDPAWGTYRNYRLAGSPPPDNGGTHIIEIMNLIEQLPLREWGLPTQNADSLYWMSRFCSEVFLDGARHRDPNSHHLPLELITSKDYARQRFELMKMSAPREVASAVPYPGSNHLTVVDKAGNVATVLHSVMSMPWTNGLIVDGVNIWAGGVHFTRVMPKPGDRATCYVAPHMFFGADGKPVLAAGSPGVGLIATCVQNAVNLLDFGMDIQESVHRPRFGGVNMTGAAYNYANAAYTCEYDCGTPEMQAEVQKRGIGLHLVSPWHYTCGTYEGIRLFADGHAEACADPRRAGAAEAA